MTTNPDRIEDVYRRRYVGFRNALATVTGSHESARDVVQDAFARALAHRDRFRGGSLEAWIWRIALRGALEARTRNRDVPVGEFEFDGTPELNGALDPRLVEPWLDPALAEALCALPPRRRLIVFLRYFADLDYAAIGEACAISTGTVAASLAQAHSQLRDALDPEGATNR